MFQLHVGLPEFASMYLFWAFLSLCKSAEDSLCSFFRISLQNRGFLQVPFKEALRAPEDLRNWAQVCPHGFLLSLLREHPCVSDVVVLATILRRFRQLSVSWRTLRNGWGSLDRWCNDACFTTMWLCLKVNIHPSLRQPHVNHGLITPRAGFLFV